VNRRAAIAAVVTVSLLFFLIRVAIIFLSKEKVPDVSTAPGDPARGGPTALPPKSETKPEVQAHIRGFASEAREAKDMKAATAAFAAEDALRRDDCAGAKADLTRAGETIPKDHRAWGAFESAQRSVDAYCR
jgi:hypothetical protein